MDNFSIYGKIAGNNNSNKVDKLVFSLILSENLKKTVLDQIKLQDDICAIINKCQEKDTNLSKAAEMWLDLKIPSGITQNLKSKYTERKNMALTKITLSAYFLDPFTDNNKITKEQEEAVKQFLDSSYENTVMMEPTGILRELEILMKGNDIIETIKSRVDNATDFWTFISGSGQMSELSKIALKLYKIPASSAQLERVFSMWNHIHNKSRNRLTFERSRKLMHIYYHMCHSETKFLY